MVYNCSRAFQIGPIIREKKRAIFTARYWESTLEQHNMFPQSFCRQSGLAMSSCLLAEHWQLDRYLVEPRDVVPIQLRGNKGARSKFVPRSHCLRLKGKVWERAWPGTRPLQAKGGGTSSDKTKWHVYDSVGLNRKTFTPTSDKEKPYRRSYFCSSLFNAGRVEKRNVKYCHLIAFQLRQWAFFPQETCGYVICFYLLLVCIWLKGWFS